MIRKILTALVAVGMMVSVASATVVSKNGIAKDSVTGLEWQDDSDTANVKKDFKNSKIYCSNLRLGGYKDWRLPNVFELLSLQYYDKKDSEVYVLDGVVYDNNAGYWSSTIWSENAAWSVGFVYGGLSGSSSMSENNGIKCVRGDELGYSKFTMLKTDGKLKIGDNKYNSAIRNYEKQMFLLILQSKSPQIMYIEAGKQERNGNTSKANQLYEAIIDRFPNSDFAVKASDKLTSASRAENEASNRGSQSSQECENTKNACLAGCGTYISGADAHNNSVWSCNDRCKKINCY